MQTLLHSTLQRNYTIVLEFLAHTSHSGRRTWLTTLSQKGVSVFVLADMAGHKSLQTTMRYVTVNDEMKRNAAELI